MAGDGHEVHVSIPAGNDMKMNMVLDAGTGDTAEIHPDIKSMRSHHLLDRPNAFRHQRHHLPTLRFSEIGKFTEMPIGNDHEMSVIVRIKIHDDEAMLPAVKDEIFSVIFLLRFQAENTAIFFLPENIINAPGSPEDIHAYSISSLPPACAMIFSATSRGTSS